MTGPIRDAIMCLHRGAWLLFERPNRHLTEIETDTHTQSMD